MLLSFPGINNKNVRFILDYFTSMQDLVKASKQTLGRVLKSESDGAQVWKFLHERMNPQTTAQTTSKPKGSYQMYKESKK